MEVHYTGIGANRYECDIRASFELKEGLFIPFPNSLESRLNGQPIGFLTMNSEGPVFIPNKKLVGLILTGLEYTPKFPFPKPIRHYEIYDLARNHIAKISFFRDFADSEEKLEE
ncbi:MAG TPA: hypothetical protein VI564_09460 [Candidatus Nanoarchaeia archaeon]|nr:hypothetical protein [Candidatus Nanoarchaeia archaeon]